MTVPSPVQHLLVTAIPRGYTEDGLFLRVGVRLTIRLSYAEGVPTATLLDFPDFHAWPIGGLAWSASFDGGTTFEPAADEIWGSDQGFWQATFPTSMRVDRKPIVPPAAKQSVFGYSHKTLAKAMKDYHISNAFVASPLGSALFPKVFPGASVASSAVPVPAELATAVNDFLTFHKSPEPSADPTPIPPSRLAPDFHQRISLLSDHGPLLERLGLAFELRFPARPQTITSITVKGADEAGAATTPITFGSVITSVANTPGSVFAAATGSAHLDDRLRLRLNDDSLFDVHAIDVDASVIAAFSLRETGRGSASPLPPPPQSTGFTITQDKTHEAVRARIDDGRIARLKLSLNKRPTVFADGMIQGYLLEVLREGPEQTWRSLCHRKVTYTAIGDGDEERRFVASSEAPVVNGLRLREVESGTPKDLETSDVMFRWDGWSLAVERPGRYQLQEDATTGDVVDTPGAFPGGTLDIAASLPTDPAQKLPVLRFGSTYRFRARAVDVTGFAHPWDGADDLASPAKPYLRYDPVAAPLVLGGPLPTRTETSLRMVVRSDPRSDVLATETSRRTVVPARTSVEMGITHGMFDGASRKAPDPAKWSKIAGLDDKVPPPVWPPVDDPDSTAPPVVDWLPDPMSTVIGVALPPWTKPQDPLLQVSFLPSGSEPLGRSALGAWQSIGLELRGVDKGGLRFGSIVERAGERVLPVELPEGWITTLVLRGLPPSSRLGEHGLAQWIPAANRDARIYNAGFDQMCPPVEVTLVHAVRQPLEDPTAPGAVVYQRAPGQKDPIIKADVRFEGLSTGRLTIVGSWSYQRDEGGFVRTSRRHRPPARVEVKHNAVAERESEEPTLGHPTKTVAGTLVAPDLRRIDGTFQVVATSRFVEEFRDVLDLTWSTLSGIDGPVLDLPLEVDVESVRLLRNGRDLVRVTEYRVIEDPRSTDGRRTLALTSGGSTDDVVVLGVEGTVLAKVKPQTLIIPAAMRPLPPDVAYVLPAFTGTSGLVHPVTKHSIASRGAPRVRIWLERPWWSSGDEEQLAVIWELDGETATDPPRPLPDDYDEDRTARLVTLFGQDPLMEAVEDTNRMTEPTSGEPFLTAGPDVIFLDEGLPIQVKAKVRLHDVEYDADRDLYYTEVEWPAHRSGKFVRLAVARFQRYVVPNLSRLSLIRTIDPVQLMPARSADAYNVSSRSFSVKVTGPAESPLIVSRHPRVRVSLQKRTASGDSELGWDTVESTSELVLGSNLKYPVATLLRPTTGGAFRILVEEFEALPTKNIAGLPTDNKYLEVPKSAGAAIDDLTGRRPVWITTLPLPENAP